VKSINWKNSIGGVVLSLSIMFGLGIALGPTAQGQYNRGQWDRGRLARFAFALGYDLGYKDAAQGSYRSYRDMQRYRDANEGWEDPMGTRTVFRDNFRRGFGQGFMDARASRAPRFSQADADRVRAELSEARGGGGQHDRDYTNRMADQNGYRDGLRLGRIDSHRGRRTDVEAISSFRSGMSGYRSQYGDREAYRQAYREAFRRGYEEGFNGRG
jgi:hypothetical protein